MAVAASWSSSSLLKSNNRLITLSIYPSFLIKSYLYLYIAGSNIWSVTSEQNMDLYMFNVSVLYVQKVWTHLIYHILIHKMGLLGHKVCSRNHDPLYLLSYHIKLVKTYWTYSIEGSFLKWLWSRAVRKKSPQHWI